MLRLKKIRAETIEDVIMIMDEIIRNCRLRGSRLAYFTVLYRTTTYLVKQYCDEGGFFEDDDRMRRLDVIFANYYFDSLFAELHYKETPPSASWQVTFEAADNPDIVLIQHLLVGMNAHISLDLGIATAIVADGKLTDSLERDFNRLNTILASLIDVVQTEIGTVSPFLHLLDKLTLRFDEHAMDMVIRLARARAWRFAEDLCNAPRNQWDDMILKHDQYIANISQRILNPGIMMQPALWLIRNQEKKAPHHIISGLAGEQWHDEAYRKVQATLGKIKKPFSHLSKRETHLMRVVEIPSDTDND